MSQFYCPRIKNGIAFTPNRDYDVCGVRNLNDSSKLGISSTLLDDFLNSDYRKNLIATAEQGEWPKGCEGCQWLEHVGLPSSRQSEITLEQTSGTLPLVHFNSGSICDSDCAMCGPRWSTTIANRLKQFPDPTSTYFTLGNDGIELPFDKKAIQNLKAAIAQARRLKVLGGEPFLDKKLWKFLDQVANNQIELIVLTNGNTYPSKKQLQILDKFEKVKLVFSIDGTGLTYEWIRQNLSYKTVIKNYLKLRSKFDCSVSAVAQAHNLLNLSDLAKSFKDNISFMPLSHPGLMAIRNAPDWAIKAALEQTQDIPGLQTILKMNLRSGPTHDLESLKSHTHYLNGHRTHYFNTNEWVVQTKR